MDVKKQISKHSDSDAEVRQKKLKAKIKMLEAENLAKTEFIANLIHDIRSPLTGIVSLASHLSEKTKSPQEKKYARVVYEGSLQLLELLNDILNLGKKSFLEENSISSKAFYLADLIEKLRELEEPSVIEHNLLLEIDIDSSIQDRFLGDMLKLQRILLNLVSNAVKFTKKGKISIGIKPISRDKDTVYLEFMVKDTGVGIPEEQQAKVFKRYFKMNTIRQENYLGNGLGLNIVQKYVRLLGGKISLQSKAGQGSRFSFVLPMKVDKGIGNKEMLPRIKSNKHNSASANRCERADSPRLLVVEDNKMALMSMVLLTRKLGIELATAVNSEMAMEAIKAHAFDLIITDIELPDGSGYGLTEKIRAMEKERYQKPIPIIGLTGHSTDEIINLCKGVGMDDVYQKPMDTRLLKKIVASTLQEKRGTRR